MTIRKMRSLAAVAVALAFAALPARAQWQTPIHSMPVGIGLGTGFRSVGPCSAGGFPVWTSPVLDPQCSTVSGTDATLTGTLTITPAASTYAKGFNITQTSPATSLAGPIPFNLITVTYSGTATGSGIDSYGQANATAIGLRINFNYASSNNTQIGAGAFVAATKVTVGGAQTIGGAFTNYSNVTGTGPMFGGNSQAFMDASGTGGLVIGHEDDIGLNGTATYRIGHNVAAAAPLTNATATGSTLDSAYTISASGTNAPFIKGFTLTKNLYGAAPIATGGDWFYVDAAMTIANGFNAANLTFGSNIFVFKNFTVDNLGNMVLGSSASSTGTIQIQPSINGTGNATNIDVKNAAQAASSTGTEISFEANEAGRTTVRYGLTLGNWAEFTAFGGGNNGLVIGEFINAPIVFGNNNAESLRILGSNIVKFSNTANFSANNARTVTVGNVGPAAIGATIAKWLTFQDSGGTLSYVPIWQ